MGLVYLNIQTIRLFLSRFLMSVSTFCVFSGSPHTSTVGLGSY